MATELVGSSPRSTRRVEILSVAADLFARKGFEGTTVRDIAETAGILSGSLYHHFKSKDQIMEEIFGAYFDEIEERWALARNASSDPAEQFEVMLRELLLAVHRHPGAARMLTNEWSNFRRIGSLHERWKAQETLGRALAEGAVAAGTFRADIDAFYLYSVAMDVVRGFAGWYRPGSRADIQQVADSYVAIVLDGLRHSSDRPLHSAEGIG